MTRRRLASQFAWVSIGRLLGALIQAITMLLLARDLGPEQFGMFSAAFGAALVVQAGLDLGMATLVVKERAAFKASPLVHSALRITDYLGFAILGTTAIPLLILANHADSFFILLLPLAIWAACERHTDTWLSVPLADGDAKVNTKNLVSKRIATILLYLAAVYVGVNPALAFSSAMALTAVISLIVVRRFVHKRLDLSNPRVSCVSVLRQSWPYWLNSLGTQARNLDTLVVTAVAGPTQAGFYAATSRATGPLRILSTSMATVLLPASASNNPNDPGQIRTLLRLVVFAGLLSSMLYGGLIAIVPLAVEVFLGEIYEGAVLPLQIVLAGLVFAAVSSLFTAILQGVGLQLFVAQTAVLTTTVCLVMVSIGAITSGAIGAALALGISFFIQATILATRATKCLRG